MDPIARHREHVREILCTPFGAKCKLPFYEAVRRGASSHTDFAKRLSRLVPLFFAHVKGNINTMIQAEKILHDSHTFEWNTPYVYALLPARSDNMEIFRLHKHTTHRFARFMKHRIRKPSVIPSFNKHRQQDYLVYVSVLLVTLCVHSPDVQCSPVS